MLGKRKATKLVVEANHGTQEPVYHGAAAAYPCAPDAPMKVAAVVQHKRVNLDIGEEEAPHVIMQLIDPNQQPDSFGVHSVGSEPVVNRGLGNPNAEDEEAVVMKKVKHQRKEILAHCVHPAV